MAGNSKWATTKRQKAITDAKRGAAFTKIGHLIAIAARQGTDPAMNPALAMAMEKARVANMPKANIERAIARVAGKDASAMTEEVYEAYGPNGVGIIIETATDNKNRTMPEVKNAVAKNGGRIAEPGSVMFQFKRKGVITVKASGEEALLTVLDSGAEDAVEVPASGDSPAEILVYTDAKELAAVRDSIVAAGLEVADAELQYVPNAEISLEADEDVERLGKIVSALEELDDVVNVSTNAG